MSSSDLLRVEGLSARWHRAPVLEDVTFQLAEGELVSLLGPNGSGKTTLLRCLVGLEPTSAGSVWVRGRSIGELPAHRRGIGMLAQEPALFPQRTVYENLVYGLEIAGVGRAEADARCAPLINMLHLRGFEDRRASQLSGGERQRVALARTLAPGPPLVLLDEPFAAMDPSIRAELTGEFREVLQKTGTAALLVTHDRDEGLFLGERVLLLVRGRLRQTGPPDEVFRHPVDAEAADYLGYNVIELDGRRLAVHPRSIHLVEPGAGELDAAVVSEGSTGDQRLAYLRRDEGGRLKVIVETSPGMLRVGQRVGVAWRDSVPLP